jgi:energy-coupling factor transporter ATP-binding protein EcfA2
MLTREQARLARRIATSRDISFDQLTKLAKLRPERDFRYARLVDIDFGRSDLTGYDFSGADLTNSDLSETSPPGPVLTGAITNGARIPSTFDADSARQAVEAAIARSKRRIQERYEGRLRDEVHDVMIVAGWHVIAEHLAGAKRIDLFCERDEMFGRRNRVAIEVIDVRAPINMSKARPIVADYMPLLNAGLIDSVVVISRTEATPQARQFFDAQKDVSFLSIDRFLSGLLNLSTYLHGLCERHQADGLVSVFVPLTVLGSEEQPIDAVSYLERWVKRDNDNVLVVVGAAGSGKSTLAEHFAYLMARQYLDGQRGRAPIHLSADSNQASLSALVSEFFTDRERVAGYSYPLFERLNRLGQFVIIIDELDAAQDGRFLTELAGLADHKSKVLLLGRPLPRLLPAPSEFSIDSGAPDNRASYPVISIEPLGAAGVTDFMRKYVAWRGAQSGRVRKEFEAVLKEALVAYDGVELLRRPLFARIAADLLVNAGRPIAELNSFTLYDALISQLLSREQQKHARRSLPESLLREACRSLAWRDWTEGKAIGLRIDKVAADSLDKISHEVGEEIDTIPDLMESPLFRRRSGRLQFAHRSFQEFLVAEHITAYLSSSHPDVNEFVAIAPLMTAQILEFVSSSGQDRVLKRIRGIILTNSSRLPPDFMNAFV